MSTTTSKKTAKKTKPSTPKKTATPKRPVTPIKSLETIITEEIIPDTVLEVISEKTDEPDLLIEDVVPVLDIKPRTPTRTPRRKTPRVQANPEPVVKEEEDIEVVYDLPNLENELRRWGYIIEDRIVIRDENGYNCKWIKAQNPAGYYVYIDLEDCEGTVKYQLLDGVYESSSQSSGLPMSIKTGMYESAGNGVHGVAFQCENGYCMITRKPDLNSEESNWIRINESTPRSQNYGIGFPIVRLKDIRVAPDTVIENVAEASDRLRADNYILVGQHMNELSNHITDLISSFNDFIPRYQSMADAVNESLCTHREELNTCEDPFIAQQIRADLQTLEDKQIQMIHLGEQIPNSRYHILHLIQLLKNTAR